MAPALPLLLLESIQINIIHAAQNHNHICSVGFTVDDTLCPWALDSSEEKLVLKKTKHLLTGKE